MSIQNNLRYRMTDVQTGGEVSALQDLLQSEGYLNSNPSGFFGLMTLAAVKKFQAAHSISPTGYVGPLTRAWIESASCAIGYTPNTTTLPTPDSRGCLPGAVYSSISGALCSTSSLQPSITVLSPNGGESYRVGDKMDVRWASSGIPSDNIVDIRLKGLNDGKEYHFPQYPLQSYNDGIESVMIQSTIPTGAYILELKTPANGGGSYLASGNSYFKVVADTPPTSEQVKCVFGSSFAVHQCYSTDGRYTFSGVGTAGGEVNAPLGAQMVWKSTCGSEYAYTTIDGNNDYARFTCPNKELYISGISTQPAQVGSSFTVYFSNGGDSGSVMLKTLDGSKMWFIPYTTGAVYNGFTYYDGNKVTFTVPSTIGRGQLPENTGYEAPTAITTGTYNLFVQRGESISSAFPILIKN